MGVRLAWVRTGVPTTTPHNLGCRRDPLEMHPGAVVVGVGRVGSRGRSVSVQLPSQAPPRGRLRRFSKISWGVGENQTMAVVNASMHIHMDAWCVEA